MDRTLCLQKPPRHPEMAEEAADIDADVDGSASADSASALMRQLPQECRLHPEPITRYWLMPCLRHSSANGIPDGPSESQPLVQYCPVRREQRCGLRARAPRRGQA